MASPIISTIIPGPGSTNSAMPRIKTVKPTIVIITLRMCFMAIFIECNFNIRLTTIPNKVMIYISYARYDSAQKKKA